MVRLFGGEMGLAVASSQQWYDCDDYQFSIAVLLTAGVLERLLSFLKRFRTAAISRSAYSGYITQKIARVAWFTAKASRRRWCCTSTFTRQ